MKNQNSDNSDSSNLFSGFKSYHHLIRFIIAIIMVWSVILVSSFVFLKHYRDVGIEATFNEKGIPLISISFLNFFLSIIQLAMKVDKINKTPIIAESFFKISLLTLYMIIFVIF